MNETTFNTVVKILTDKIRELESEISWLEHQLKERERICDKLAKEVEEWRASRPESPDL